MKHTIKITSDEAWRRLWKIIKNNFSSLPLTNIFKLFRKWEVKINWKKANTEDILKIWDEVSIFTRDVIAKVIKTKNKISEKFFNENFKVIYEDKDILAVNKPAWVAVHPGTKHYQGQTMIDLAEHYIEKEYWKLFIQLVHRIDADTSWVLIFAKSGKTLIGMNELIKNREMEKCYYGLVFWKFAEKKWTIKTFLEKIEWAKFNKMQISKSGLTAITHYKVINEFKIKNDSLSLLDINLETWRMHQIRVHVKAKRHPLVLDKMYWDFEKNRDFEKKFWLKRQFLHAYYVKFIHPDTWRKVEIRAELNNDLKKCLEKIQS